MSWCELRSVSWAVAAHSVAHTVQNSLLVTCHGNEHFDSYHIITASLMEYEGDRTISITTHSVIQYCAPSIAIITINRHITITSSSSPCYLRTKWNWGEAMPTSLLWHPKCTPLLQVLWHTFLCHHHRSEPKASSPAQVIAALTAKTTHAHKDMAVVWAVDPCCLHDSVSMAVILILLVMDVDLNSNELSFDLKWVSACQNASSSSSLHTFMNETTNQL